MKPELQLHDVMSEHDFQNKMDGKLDNYHHERAWNIEMTLKSQPDTLSAYIKKSIYQVSKLAVIVCQASMATLYYILCAAAR